MVIERRNVEVTPEMVSVYKRCKEINAGSPRTEDETIETVYDIYHDPFNNLKRLLKRAPWEFSVFDFPENDPGDLGDWAGAKAMYDALEEAIASEDS